MNSLIWFRRDLRTEDNPALYHAAKVSKQGVVAVYILTPNQWLQHDDSPCKVQFWLENLKVLSAELADLNIPLLIATVNDFSEVADVLLAVAEKNQCQKLFFNLEYESNELNRDADVVVKFADRGMDCGSFHDRTIVPPNRIQTQEGRFYSVFTPFRRAWENIVLEFIETLPKPTRQKQLDIATDTVPKKIDGFEFGSSVNHGLRAGNREAHHRLKQFLSRIADYATNRDLPAVTGTSGLSPYLAAGVISPRSCLLAALAANNGRLRGNDGPTTWISELAWRDFYMHVLVSCPRVSKNQPFKLKTKSIPWRTSNTDFAAWKTGQTGYPIVDAGMRQLNQMGWMHNRLRMVTAMFLSKHLLIDWRWGERYFMHQLIDGDLAANNGGWQWSASTGTDSVPYFRIFNPFSQSKRFDPDGVFIKKYCPELSGISATALHDPKKLTTAVQSHKIDYPPFLVDHQFARQRVLAAFKA